MMKGYLLTAEGEKIWLPPFSGWRLRRTGSVPCDSFEGNCPWDGGVESALDRACRLIVEQEGARRFTGVLDEYEICWDETGGELTVSGRGLAALLLDNEARGQDYQVATLKDILRDHVEPYGVPVGRVGELAAVPGFSVSSGESEWQVLYDFARYHNGVQPRLDAWGSLTVEAGDGGKTVLVDDRSGVMAVRWRDKRYGVCSEILIQDRKRLGVQRITNDPFIAQGGQRRQVMTQPGKGAYQGLRYSGQFQLDRSAEERFRAEITLPGSYFCEPGDQVSLRLTRPAIRGGWTVQETEAVLDKKGQRVKLTLG